jgi:hypothetical protein
MITLGSGDEGGTAETRRMMAVGGSMTQDLSTTHQGIEYLHVVFQSSKANPVQRVTNTSSRFPIPFPS